MSDNSININTPEIGPYTQLRPFRFWCQKVLPLVYDESLSYYELLCKVVDYLNKTMEDVDQMITDMGEFQTAYTDFTTETRDAYIAFSREVSQTVEGLETFMNNYFNNLDVQQEINNKLDAMAAAGYFSTLFTTLFTSDIITEAGNVTSAWIAENLLQETGYVIDNSLTVANAAADAKATGDRLNLLDDIIGKQEVNWTDNYYIGTIGEPTAYSIYSYSNKINLFGTKIHVKTRITSTSYYVIAFYDAHDEFVSGFLMPDTSLSFTYEGDVTIPTDAVYARINCLTTDISTYFEYELTDLVTILNRITALEKLKNDINASIKTSDFSDTVSWEIGSIYSIDGSNFNTNVGIRTPTTALIKVENDLYVSCSHKALDAVYVFRYRYNRWPSEYLGRFGPGNPVKLEAGYYYRIVILFTEEITEATINDFINTVYFGGYDFAKVMLDIYKPKTIGIDYAVTPLYNKISLNIEKLSGQLSQAQSFCVYNGKIYCTGGSGYVDELSMTDFSVLRHVSIWTGHGNVLQLGNDGLAYASGWDDNKIYVINLDDMTLEDTITLPTTGYTNCLVDDVNKIAYILQRDSEPSTEEYYNFITYDYDNETVISTKKLTVKMGALQDCDFVDGKIYVSNGLGTVSVPNGFRVFNTSGDLIGEYVLGSKANVEPEGFAIDRTTNTIYLSLIDYYVYKLNFPL